MRRTLTTTTTRLPMALTALAVAVCVAVTGCAPRTSAPDVTGEPDDPRAHVLSDYDRQWSCVPIDGPGVSELTYAGDGWASEGGRMVSTRVSRPEGPELPGRSSPGDALDDAVAAATEAALGLLEQRGVAYNRRRRADMVEEAVRASSRGDEIPFPRVSVVGSVVEECVVREDDAPADTCWRAAVRVEYPIGYLRGDANNVRWERSRAVNEARVLRNSASDHFGVGRWSDGLLDAARAAEVVFGTGLPVSAFEASDPDSAGGRAAIDSASIELVSIVDGLRRLVEDAAPLEARPENGVTVVEAGAASRAEVEFEIIYRLDNHGGTGGFEVPAAGVPVIFAMPGASAVLEGAAVTDGDGVARCRIARVNGPPGDYELEVRADAEAMRSALLWFTDPTAIARTPLTTAPVHVVRGGHATSVCFDLDAADPADAAQSVAGFTRRMERDGFRLTDCGPDVDVVITGSCRLRSAELEDGWRSRVVIDASAFDQRTASSLGETTVSSDESVTKEPDDGSGDVGRRRAEVLALKEAGRLLAVYFEGRILSSGS